ncbi:MAG: phage tail sheath subtilisin-like domain-containing protein [Cytophagales bacterium]|nr:phage tail sheath subtilisin-like domain-containing protein [Cytophagales bacterium]
MAEMKTPGVYIKEKNAFPNSVVEVATAVPVFIGYTEKASYGGNDLTNKPFRISSLKEYHDCFGEGPFTNLPEEGKDYLLNVDENLNFSFPEKKHYRFHHAVRFFYQNGGGPCFIVSVGKYGDEISKEGLLGADNAVLEVLEKEQEPTMIVVPEAMSLDLAGSKDVQTACLAHCGKMASRVAILDVFEGFKGLKDNVEGGDKPPVETFREGIGTEFLMYGAAYYPWLDTSVIQDSEMGLHLFSADAVNVVKEKAGEDFADVFADLSTRDNCDAAHKILMAQSVEYKQFVAKAKEFLNIASPAAAMAGVYSMVDNTRGVWKAPANVSLNGVIAPSVNISDEEQQSLNVDLNGKSINAIRPFVGQGILVWGARTLDGNSGDWRYINVRRTVIMLEQSIKAAAKAMVFEPNVSSTWVTVQSMIENFLYQQWKNGALAGTAPADAYSVSVGLGSTMTGEDILNGIMRITVLIAVSRPAEFIEITFQQQMQKS